MFFTIIQIITDAIEELAGLYRTMMHNLAYGILRDYQSAEDAVQDALLSLSQNMDKLDNIHSRQSQNYIYTVTKNAALSVQKKESRYAAPAYDEEEIQRIPGQLDVDAFADQYGFSPRVAEALEQLTPMDRDILCWRYGAGYRPKEIAKYLGKSPDFVYKRIQRAEARLADIFTRKEGDQ